MTRLLLIVLVMAFLVACGAGGVPTLVPTAAGQGGVGIGGDSPRGPADNGLPPTWTPAPTEIVVTPELPALPTAALSSGQTYSVQPGDTLGEIAQRFGVSLDDLVRVNSIVDIDVIEVGQLLVIP